MDGILSQFSICHSHHSILQSFLRDSQHFLGHYCSLYLIFRASYFYPKLRCTIHSINSVVLEPLQAQFFQELKKKNLFGCLHSMPMVIIHPSFTQHWSCYQFKTRLIYQRIQLLTCQVLVLEFLVHSRWQRFLAALAIIRFLPNAAHYPSTSCPYRISCF